MYGNKCVRWRALSISGLFLMNSHQDKHFIIPKSFMDYYFYNISKSASNSPITGLPYTTISIKLEPNSLSIAASCTHACNSCELCRLNTVFCDHVILMTKSLNLNGSMFNMSNMYVQRAVWYFTKSKRIKNENDFKTDYYYLLISLNRFKCCVWCVGRNAFSCVFYNKYYYYYYDSFIHSLCFQFVSVFSLHIILLYFFCSFFFFHHLEPYIYVEIHVQHAHNAFDDHWGKTKI